MAPLAKSFDPFERDHMARPKKTDTDDTQTPESIAALEEQLAQAKKKVKYNFQKQAGKLHSLYKLLSSTFKKNTSFTSVPNWEDAEHVHFFHSISSSGDSQTTCVPIGGHFHEMIMVTPATETEPAVYKCSGPLKKVRQKNSQGYWEVVSVPANGVDNHTHEVEYKHSEIWSPTPMNPEFIKLQTQMAAKIVQSDQFIEQ
jgi:hypothetical protein